MNLQLFNCFNHIEGNNNHKQEKNDTTNNNNNTNKQAFYKGDGNNKAKKENTEIFHGIEDSNNIYIHWRAKYS